MPRISAENRAGAAFRAGGKRPEPPASLSPEAREIWRAIVASKPIDWFDDGALPLLKKYCETAAQSDFIDQKMVRLRKRGTADEQRVMEKRSALQADKLVALATKLRLSVQALVERHSRKILETGPGESAADRLLGGAAVWDEGAKPN